MAGEAEDVRAFLVDLSRFLLGGSAEGVFLAREAVVAAGRRYGVRADVLVLPDQLVLTVDYGGAQSVDVVETTPGLSLDRMERAKQLAGEIDAPVITCRRRRASWPWGGSRRARPGWCGRCSCWSS